MSQTFDSSAGVVRPWRPAPAIVATMFAHAAGVAVLAPWPAGWPWVVAVLLLNHLVLIGAVFVPRGQLLGPNVTRLPAAAAARREVSLTFDDGPDPVVTPAVLDLLDRHQARASFFCIGRKAALYPELVREIARRGHSVENHSQRHTFAFALLGPWRLRREVAEAQARIAAMTGRAPSFFRAPAGFRSPLLEPVLAAAGLRYVSWTRRGYDTVTRDPQAVLRRLTAGLAAGDVLLLHDGSSALTSEGRPVVLEVLPRLLERLARHGLKAVPLPAGCRDEPGA